MSKICTSIKQSKKLIELGLDVNTADMRYGYIAPYDYSDRMYDGGYDEIPYPKDFLVKNPNFSANEYDAELPCWSLAALLDVLPISLNILRDGRWNAMVQYDGETIYEVKDNPVDACVAIIEKLHELKML